MVAGWAFFVPIKRLELLCMNDNNNYNIDLGSDTEEFDPFASEDELDDGADDTTVDTPAPQPIVQKQAKTVAITNNNSNDSDNSVANATDNAETKYTEKAKISLYEKPPIFDYAGATENIEDSSLTFDELRIAKATDFPELEDGKRVSWTVEYGKITKTVTDAKGTSIAKMKSDIETSKAFTDALKKSKDKNPVCKVKPRVTAQSKGVVLASDYKGVFRNMSEVEEAGKVISYLPARDGKVYETRKTLFGRFTTPVVGCELLSDVKAGFIPAEDIPRIPMDLTMKIISFFRHYSRFGNGNEALVNIYWDSHNEEFIVDTPTQIVSKTSVYSKENLDYTDDRFIHFMDIHSHNSMQAFFSHVDDEDEKATRLYTVIGRLDSYFPELNYHRLKAVG